MDMTDEKSQDNDVLKIEIGDEIPVEEEPIVSKANKEKPDLVDELSKLGRQFGETVNAAWNSEERRRFESEVKEGAQSFAKEVDKAFHEVREGSAAQKAKDEASDFRSKVQEAELGHKAQSSLAQGLRWMSVELENLAQQFTSSEKQPEDLSTDEPEETS
jgi:replicative superfamily II helicase